MRFSGVPWCVITCTLPARLTRSSGQLTLLTQYVARAARPGRAGDGPAGEGAAGTRHAREEPAPVGLRDVGKQLDLVAEHRRLDEPAPLPGGGEHRLVLGEDVERRPPALAVRRLV